MEGRTWKATNICCIVEKEYSGGLAFYSVCDGEEEAVDHLFISCWLDQVVWCLHAQWCKVPSIYVFSVRYLVEFYMFSHILNKKLRFSIDLSDYDMLSLEKEKCVSP